jgi:hypothetical protein
MIEAKVTNSLKSSVLDLIQKDYQFIAGDKIQHMFAGDVVDLVNKCYRDQWTWIFTIIIPVISLTSKQTPVFSQTI